MQTNEIYKILDEISPFSLQEEWDKSGLCVDMQGDAECIYLGLDLSLEDTINAPKNTLFITHHPLIFSPIKDFKNNAYPKNIIRQMILKNQGLISMHTNFDKTHLNEYFATKVLNFKISKKNDFLIYCDVDFSFDEFVKHIKKSLEVDFLRCVKTKDKVLKIAICTGSGSELVNELDSDVDYFLTGDLKYHFAFECKENGIGLIDINHFESERYFGEILAPILKNHLQNFSKRIIIKDYKNPFLTL